MAQSGLVGRLEGWLTIIAELAKTGQPECKWGKTAGGSKTFPVLACRQRIC
jgi:hypothetical protein